MNACRHVANLYSVSRRLIDLEPHANKHDWLSAVKKNEIHAPICWGSLEVEPKGDL
jgi:hypothetical protein